MYSFRTSLGPVDLAFTDRFGGASGVPYAELNLGINTADDPDVVAANLRTLLDDFSPGAGVVDLWQVHGADVASVGAHDLTDGRARLTADAVITSTPDITLVVRVADCVPILLADPERGVVGAVHAGRPGLAAGIVPEAVAALHAQGAESLTAWVGPHVCGACYEVPVAMQEEVAALVPQARATTSWGTPALDIGAGVRAQLEESGVTVVDVSRCTRESADLYSHRRDGDRSGRLAGLVRIRS